MSFEVGDRVTITGPAWTDNLGKTGTVTETWVSDNRHKVRVAMDDVEAYPKLEWKFAAHLAKIVVLSDLDAALAEADAELAAGTTRTLAEVMAEIDGEELMTHGHPASGPPVDPADMRVPTGPAPGASNMGAIAQEELRRAAYYVTEALALGHQCDPGLAERIARLADVLGRTRGWRP